MKEMAKTTDLKMAMLAVLIVLTTVICTQDENRVAEIEPVLIQAPAVDTRVLAS